MSRPKISLVVSNPEKPNSARPCSTLPARSSTSSELKLSTTFEELQELLYLKPSYVGGIALLVRDELRRQRREHPTAALEYQRLGRPSGEGVRTDLL